MSENPKSDRSRAGRHWRVYAGAAVAAGLMSAGAYVTGLEPLVRRQAEQASRRAELEDRRQQVAAATDALGELNARLADTRQALGRTALRLEPASAINRRLALLTALARDSGLEVDELKPGAPSNGPHHRAVPLRLAGGGSYPACSRFLHELRARFPDVSVRSFETSRAGPAEAPAGPGLRTAAGAGAPGSFRFELVWFTSPERK